MDYFRGFQERTEFNQVKHFSRGAVINSDVTDTGLSWIMPAERKINRRRHSIKKKSVF